VIDLPFLSPRALSAGGKLEVRGADVAALAVGHAEVIRISPCRALVLCDPARRQEVAQSLPGFVVDVTAAWAALEVDGERLMRRLTDLDLEALPAVGKVATVQAVVSRDGDRFRVLVPTELSESVAELVAEERASLR
jgi:hypothetical protein